MPRSELNTEASSRNFVVLQYSFRNLTLQEQQTLSNPSKDIMPPQRRKRLEIVEDNKTSIKRIKSTMNSSRRSSKSNEVNDNGFVSKRCIALFQEYVSADDQDVIGPEGMEKFCEDIGVEPENILMLVLAWKMDAKQMGFFTLTEWLRGLTDIQCDTIQKIQSHLDQLRTVLNDATVFKNIYRYAYDFARDKNQRSMDIETAKAMLQLLLGKHWSLYGFFNHFLEQSKYKVINKDQWCNVLEFSRTICNDLSNYDEDGAWPVLLDEFVEWLKLNRTFKE